MKIIFNTWADAIRAANGVDGNPPELKIEGPEFLFLIFEGSVKDRPYEGSNYPHSWTIGTGRVIVSDRRTGEQVGLIVKNPNHPAARDGRWSGAYA